MPPKKRIKTARLSQSGHYWYVDRRLIAWRLFNLLLIALIALSPPVVLAQDRQHSSHVESVPIEQSHPDPIPEQMMKMGDGAELKGRVERDEEAVFAALNAGLGIVVKKEGKDSLPARITTVYTGSPMARRGVAGDRLVGEVTDKGVYTITVEHNGQGMRFTIHDSEVAAYSQAAKDKLAAALSAAAVPRPLKGGALAAPPKGNKQFQSLKDVFENHDLVMIIDRSGSMTTKDCPRGMSRWDWCCSQARELAEAAAEASSSITTVFFNHEYYVFDRLHPQDIPMLFGQYQPIGGTILGQPLSEQLDNYWRARSKPLIIAIVTDGMPNDPAAVAECINEASNQLRYVGEVTITFLLVGDEVNEERLRAKLGERMGGSVKNGGMVDVIPFDTLTTKGVKQAFFEELREVRLATDRTKPSKAGQFQAFTPPAPSYQAQGTYPRYGSGTGSSTGYGMPYGGDPARASLNAATQQRSDLERALLNKYH